MSFCFFQKPENRKKNESWNSKNTNKITREYNIENCGKTGKKMRRDQPNDN